MKTCCEGPSRHSSTLLPLRALPTELDLPDPCHILHMILNQVARFGVYLFPKVMALLSSCQHFRIILSISSFTNGPKIPPPPVFHGSLSTPSSYLLHLFSSSRLHLHETIIGCWHPIFGILVHFVNHSDTQPNEKFPYFDWAACSRTSAEPPWPCAWSKGLLY